MNNILAIDFNTPEDVAKSIAAKVKLRRLELDLTQKGLAERAGLSFATYRRFEQSGEISLRGLLAIAFALDMLSDFDSLFNRRQYRTLDDVIAEQTVNRKRGKRR